LITRVRTIDIGIRGTGLLPSSPTGLDCRNTSFSQAIPAEVDKYSLALGQIFVSTKINQPSPGCTI